MFLLGNTPANIIYIVPVGNRGYTWCPATFGNGKRGINNFVQMQFFVLDFDYGVTWEEISGRAKYYNLPVLFAYETFSSVNMSKFRVIFLNDIAITDKKTANVIISALMAIFPECDSSCRDVSHIFFGGKNLFYYDENIPEIGVEILFDKVFLSSLDYDEIIENLNKTMRYLLKHIEKVMQNHN